jgi:hypothetical protein
LGAITIGAAIVAFLKFNRDKPTEKVRTTNTVSPLEGDATSEQRNITANIYYENVNTSGGNCVQVNYIDMSQDLAQAAPQIQNLFHQLQQRGIATNVAQEQIARDIAAEAEKNKNMKEKLFQWGVSLASATVSDVVKGIVKLACNLVGIPL